MVGGSEGDDAGRVLLYVRGGCHLCAAGREVVTGVTSELGIPFTEVDIDVSPSTRSLFGELVPAVTVDGVLVDHWRIDPLRLRRAIEAGRPTQGPA